MPLENIQARATLTVCHERPYDFDEAKGFWLYRRLDDDEQYRNILTDAGRVTLHTFIYGTTAQRVEASLGDGLHFIGLSNNSALPTSSDTELAGELLADGLERVEGLVVLPTDSGAVTQVRNVFTFSGFDAQSVQKAALFDALSGGHMAHELLFNQRVLSTGDTLTLVFNITLA